MPHLSKQKLDESIQDKLDDCVVAFLVETSYGTRQKIFKELFTKTERMMIAKRLTMLSLIIQNTPTHEVGRILKMSSSTISRFELLVEMGRFDQTVRWLKMDRIRNSVVRILVSLLSVPFEARRKSLKRLIEE